MKCNPPSFSPRPWAHGIVFLVLCALVFWMTGCAVFTKTRESGASGLVKGADRGLSQKVGILWPEVSNSSMDENLAKTFQDTFIQSVDRQSRTVLVSTPQDKTFPRQLMAVPRLPAGWADNFTLAKTGRQFGFNALVIAGVIDISGQEEESGFLWFKKTHRRVHLQGVLEIYDTETGAKLLDEEFAHTIDAGEAVPASSGAGKVEAAPMLTAAVTKLADAMGKKTGAVITGQPWKGYVVAVNGHQIVISPGENSGLKPGMIFDVFDGVEILAGQGGLKFFKPGRAMTGQIKLTAVQADRAEAVLVSGKLPRVDSTVRPPQ
ncbi:MAG: hypothetical protein Q8P24_12660 [Desulfobacterales bacterium]|nr:hypothetical protein [Desulfobacterales bacterium]